jgi:hypothetical protein
MDNQGLTHFLSGVFPADDSDFSTFSPLRKALPSFASQVFQLRPDMIATDPTGDLTARQVKTFLNHSLFDGIVTNWHSLCERILHAN